MTSYLTHEGVERNKANREALQRINQPRRPRYANGGLIRPDPTPAFLAALEHGHDEGTPIPAPRKSIR